MASIKVNLFWNTLNTIGRLGISFIATIVLSRLLSPADFGIWGLIALFVSISELLSDSGMGGYLIKKQNATSKDYNTLFVYNLAMSIILYILIFYGAPLIADFYNNHELIGAVRVAFLAVLFQAIGITPTSKLLKEMRFKELAAIALISGILSFLIAIILAYRGCGYWALIYQHILATLFASVGVFAFSRHLPKFQFNIPIFKEQFSFGINLMGGNLLNSLTTNITNNVIGKCFNLSLTGLYVQASKLQGISTSMISSVVDKTFFPHFSKLNNSLEQIHKNGHVLARRMYAYCFPLFLVVIFFAKLIVKILLGAQWIECTPILQLLMLASFPALGKAMNRNILKSTGNTHAIFLVELYSTIFIALVLCFAIIVESFWIIVIAFVVTQYLSYFFSIVQLKRNVSFNLGRLIVDITIFLPLVIIPLIIGAIFGFCFTVFVLTFFPMLFIYNLIGVKEYQVSNLFNDPRIPK